jgi:hypothetical protein
MSETTKPAGADALGGVGLYWVGTVGRCDICNGAIKAEFIDGATTRGPWASMDPKCHRLFGRGFGPGRGQRYQRQADGRWLRVEG